MGNAVSCCDRVVANPQTEGRRRQVPAAIDPVARRRRQAKREKEKSRRRPRSNTASARVPSRAPVESVSPSPRDKDRERQPENRERESSTLTPRRMSTTPGAGRDRPGSSTAPPGQTRKRKKPPPPSIQHSISTASARVPSRAPGDASHADQRKVATQRILKQRDISLPELRRLRCNAAVGRHRRKNGHWPEIAKRSLLTQCGQRACLPEHLHKVSQPLPEH